MSDTSDIYDDHYEDFENSDVPDGYCPFHPGPDDDCESEDHFSPDSATEQ